VVNDAKLTAGQAKTNGEIVISYTPSSKLGAAPPVHSAHRFTIALKRCTAAAKRHCTRRLIPATFRFAIDTTDRLTLIRHGYVYATGARRGKQLVLNAHRHVTTGRYTLVVAKRRAGHWYVLKRRIHIS
jgi:hypothetical protein